MVRICHTVCVYFLLRERESNCQLTRQLYVYDLFIHTFPKGCDISILICEIRLGYVYCRSVRLEEGQFCSDRNERYFINNTVNTRKHCKRSAREAPGQNGHPERPDSALARLPGPFEDLAMFDLAL